MKSNKKGGILKLKRNEDRGFNEIYKDEKFFGLLFSIDDLWKRRVYVTYSNVEKKQSDNPRQKRVS